MLEYIKDNWKNNRYLFILDNINMIFGVFAATTLSLSYGKSNTNWFLIYTTYNISSIAGVCYSIKRKTIPLLILNTCYLIANCIGFYRAW